MQRISGSCGWRDRRGCKCSRLTSLLCCHVRNANTGLLTAHRVHLSAVRTLCPCSPRTAFPLLLSQSLQLEVFDLFSFSIKLSSQCQCLWSRQCWFLITLSGAVLLFTVAPLPVVCGFTPGCWRDDLIPVRICWSYSIMQHPKSAAVHKHISLSTFYFMLFYLSGERNRTNWVKYTLAYSLLNGLYLDSSSMQETPTTLQSLRTEDISFISVGVGAEAYYFGQEAEYTSHQLITGWIYRDK